MEMRDILILKFTRYTRNLLLILSILFSCKQKINTTETESINDLLQKSRRKGEQIDSALVISKKKGEELKNYNDYIIEKYALKIDSIK